MSTIDIINNIKEETGSKLTPAQICYEFKKAMSGVTEEEIKSYQSKDLSNDKKEEALNNIGEFLASREADNQIPNIDELTNNKENLIENTSSAENNFSKGTNNNSKDKDKIDDKALLPPTDKEVKQFVIPVVADKIIANGKDGKEANTITYDSDNFSAMLTLGDEEQTISLDRNNSETENTNALVASKGNNQQEYQIILNNLKREEFEKFKALFDKASHKQTSEEESSKGNELD